MRRLLVRAALLALGLVVLAGCKDKPYPASIVGYNHTDQGLRFSVNGHGNIYQHPHSGGGGSTCCIGVPAQWRPDATVKVQWLVGADESMREREVAVPRYDRGGSLSVHFLNGDRIKVFITPYALWHPDYPLKGEDAQIKPGQDPRPPR